MSGKDLTAIHLIRNIFLGLLFLFLMHFLTRMNYILYHSSAEFLSVALAWSIFLLVWSTRKISVNNSFLFLGIAYFFIGFIDMVHTLSYKGMHVFNSIDSADTATQLWIASRIMEAVSMFLFTSIIKRKNKIKGVIVISVYAVVTVLVLSVIFYTRLFPRCYIEGQGLTLFKKVFEYIICFIFLLSMWRLYTLRKKMDNKVYIYSIAAFTVTIASELFFTVYTDVYGFNNAMGHFLKIISFGLIFQAIVQSSVYRPYSTIFRKLKEDTEELTISHALHSSLIANISDVLVVLDENSAFKYISPNIEELFGWSPEFIMNSSNWDRIHPDDIDRLKEALSSLTNETGRIETVQLRYLCSDGHYAPIEMTGRNLLDDPAIQGVLINFHDISERLESAKELQNSEERFRALHNASFGGIIIHDQGIILECNQGLSEITGYEYSELIGMDGFKLISEDTRDLVKEKIRAGYEKDYEARGCRKNGEEFPLRLEARNIPYKGKDVRVVEFRDISKEKKAEEEKNKLEENLRQIQKMETVGRLAGGIAHEFNNMLGVIQGYTEIMLELESPGGPYYKYLNEIQKASQRSADLTRQLLAFAREQVVNRQILDLNATILPMLEMLDKLTGEEIHLHWSPGKDAGRVKIDPNQLNQILVNLCLNARDDIENRGTISIETGHTTISEEECEQWEGCSPGEYATLLVADTGPELNGEYKAHIFEPFYRNDFEKPAEFNLALSAVYGCVRQNEGLIKLQSQAGKGNWFTIYLPEAEE